MRALTFLASQPQGKFYSIKGLAEELHLSFHFLTKIFQFLTEEGILMSIKGPRGGVALARSPHHIQLIEVVKAIDGVDVFHECVMGLPGCGHQMPCPLHEKWTMARTMLKAMFETTTLAEAADKVPFSRLKGELEI